MHQRCCPENEHPWLSHRYSCLNDRPYLKSVSGAVNSHLFSTINSHVPLYGSVEIHIRY